MALTKQGNFTFNHSNQQDDLYKAMSAAETKVAFDSRGEELKTTLNNLVDSINSTTTGNSGAKNVGVESIAGLTGNDVQALLSALKNQMDSTVLGQIPDGAVTEAKLSSDVKAGLIDYAATTGTANAYVVTLNPAPTAYTDGMAISVKINADATAASTLNANSLGAKSLKKSNGTDVTNLKTNGVYTFRYNSTTGNFILQGEGGSGTATAPDVLAGKTASTDTGDITGTMVDRGSMTITPGTTDQIIPAGKHDGTGKIVGDADLIAANILSTANIFNVQGTATAGKKWASGTANGYIGTVSALDANGGSVTTGKLTVTGLNFQPSTVMFAVTSGGYNVGGVSTLLPKRGGYTIATNQVRIDGSTFYLNNGSFCVPIGNTYTGGDNYTWEAYE
jgi:hypothetical protein